MPNFRTLGQPLIEESIQARKKEEENTVNSGHQYLPAIRRACKSATLCHKPGKKTALSDHNHLILHFMTLCKYVL